MKETEVDIKWNKRSTDLIQSLWKYQDIFHCTRINNHKIHIETGKAANGQIICNKGGKNIQWRKDHLLISGSRKTEVTCKITRLEHSVTPYTKINSKWFKGIM